MYTALKQSVHNLWFSPFQAASQAFNLDFSGSCSVHLMGALQDPYGILLSESPL